MNKPYSQASENNKLPIFDIIKDYFNHSNMVLEIGSGTGQHAVYFAPNFPNLEWVTSDVIKNHEGIKMWLKDAKLQNIHGPLTYEVGVDKIPYQKFDYIFSANSLHIMSWKKVKNNCIVKSQ